MIYFEMFLRASVKAYVIGTLLVLLTTVTLRQFVDLQDAMYWHEQARLQQKAQANCITDMECEQAYGFDMGGQPL